jgi:hypothetical protein
MITTYTSYWRAHKVIKYDHRSTLAQLPIERRENDTQKEEVELDMVTCLLSLPSHLILLSLLS